MSEQKVLIKSKNEHNFKRSNTLSALKRKNLVVAKKIGEFLKSQKDLNDLQASALLSMQKSLNLCSNHSLYGESDNGTMVHYAPIDTCGRKTCFICNYNRQKTIRRKYAKWFTDNSFLVRIDRKKNRRFESKVVTKLQLNKYIQKGWNVLDENVQYDLMHLTLTVPHNSEGFNNDKYYFSQIQDFYKEMRKQKFWYENVFGGEYGIEATNKDNGYHIHIHSLIFVRKFKQNRNTLHKEILKYWNSVAVDNNSNRQILYNKHIDSILESNSLLIKEDVLKLNPKGATFIGLENIYTIDENGVKIRKTEKALLKAIMETISYHFEPLFFDKKDKSGFDIEAYSDVLPFIYKKPLYEKFGILRGEASLNIKENQDIKAKFKEEYTDVKGLIVDEETGEISKNIKYIVVNPAYVYHNIETQTIHISNRGKDRQKIYEDMTLFRVVDIVAEQIRHRYRRL